MANRSQNEQSAEYQRRARSCTMAFIVSCPPAIDFPAYYHSSLIYIESTYISVSSAL